MIVSEGAHTSKKYMGLLLYELQGKLSNMMVRRYGNVQY